MSSSSDLFQEQDPLQRDRFNAVFGAAAALTGERRLMYAVLEDAIMCFTKHAHERSDHGLALHEEAKRWITSDDRSAVFAFVVVCEELGLQPQALRQYLLRSVRLPTRQPLRASSHPSPAKMTERQEGEPMTTEPVSRARSMREMVQTVCEEVSATLKNGDIVDRRFVIRAARVSDGVADVIMKQMVAYGVLTLSSEVHTVADTKRAEAIAQGEEPTQTNGKGSIREEPNGRGRGEADEAIQTVDETLDDADGVAETPDQADLPPTSEVITPIVTSAGPVTDGSEAAGEETDGSSAASVHEHRCLRCNKLTPKPHETHLCDSCLTQLKQRGKQLGVELSVAEFIARFPSQRQKGNGKWQKSEQQTANTVANALERIGGELGGSPVLQAAIALLREIPTLNDVIAALRQRNVELEAAEADLREIARILARGKK